MPGSAAPLLGGPVFGLKYFILSGGNFTTFVLPPVKYTLLLKKLTRQSLKFAEQRFNFIIILKALICY